MPTIKWMAALLMLVLVAACGDSTGVSGSTHLGTYTLRTIDNQALPVTLEFDLTIVGSSITLSADGTYTVRFDLRVGNGPTSSESIGGDYTRSGNTILLDEGVSMAFSGGNTLTIIDSGDGSVWVYRM
jgi:hypothetical protein